MGRFKPLLPLGRVTVTEHIVATLRDSGIHDIRFVLGHRAHDVIPVLKKAGVSWIVNEAYRTEMLNSIRVGVGRPAPDSAAFLVLPVDIPLVRPQTLRSLMDVFGKDTRRIVYPAFMGERGHPPLIPRHYAADLMCWAGGGGLKGFLEDDHRRFVDVPVYDEGILMDMDTPEQYRRVIDRYENRRIPSLRECRAILASRFVKGHPLLEHAGLVARTGRVIGAELLRAGCQVDVDLIEVCGYLHDVGKGEKDHAGFGADLLAHLGFANVSEVIASHMDLVFGEEGTVTEKEVVYLADKMVQGQSLMTLSQRLASRLKRFAGQPEAKRAAENRIATAMRIERVIEKIIGKKLVSLLDAG
jgi:molybdenum cofactor cytidylyltransferase